MHARNRYPGNGYRSNSMVIGGMATASRISAESSLRDQGAHSYEYRSFDHVGYGRGQSRSDHGGYGGRGQSRLEHGGYGGRGQSRLEHGAYGRGQLMPDHGDYGRGQLRPDHGDFLRGQSRPEHGDFVRGQSRPDHDDYRRGQSRQFHRPPQQNQSDVFLEAGRLATEYLVSRGLLPSNVLSGKWRSDSFDNQVEADLMQVPSVGRTSALSRLGGPFTDVGPGRRRHQDDYNSISSNNMRDRRSGSFKNSSPECSREFRRSGSFSDRSRASLVADDDKDAFSSRPSEPKISNSNIGGSASQKRTVELALEKDNSGTLGPSLKKHELINNAGAKTISSSRGKDLSVVGDVEPLQTADEPDTHPEAGEIKDENDYVVTEQQQIKDDVASQETGECVSSGGSDLTKFSSFYDVPSKTSSPMAVQEFKVDADDITINEDTPQDETSKESGSCVNNMIVSSVSGNDSSTLQSDHLELPSNDDELLVTHEDSHHESPPSVSEVDAYSSKEQVMITNEELPECVMVSSSERGEKRVTSEESSPKKDYKRPKISAGFETFQSEGHLPLLDSSGKQPNPEESMVFEDGAVLLPSEEKRSHDMSLYPKDDMDCTEEKQLFPGSFRPFELNLMEASDINGNQNKNILDHFPSATERGKQLHLPVNVDLSMSNNNSHVSGNFSKCSISGKDIEVIDLENETEQGVRGFINSERRSENEFTCLDGYSNNTHNGNDTSDGQDGYGLMISELLGNDIPNCSSVSTDLSSLHSDICVHGGENILGDDDSIYMSLDEIPISFLRVWEQPNQDYSKPF